MRLTKTMNTYVADPHWGWWIVWYFYVGGIAAGAYFVAALIEFVGDENDRRLGRVGYLLAAPLVAVCGVLLILDLDQPTRFWHMLFDAETWLPHLKYWSPMSIGAWALLMFGAISTVSFIGALAESGRGGLGRFAATTTQLHRGMLGRAFDLVGTICGLFIASYTGTLLTATNQPVWSDSPWIAAMFLTSSATAGVAAMRLLAACSSRIRHESLARLGRVDGWALGLELLTILAFLGSLHRPAARLLDLWPVHWLLVGSLGLGVCVPLALRACLRPARHWLHVVAAVLALAGGFILRYAVLAMAPAAIGK